MLGHWNCIRRQLSLALQVGDGERSRRAFSNIAILGPASGKEVQANSRRYLLLLACFQIHEGVPFGLI